MKKALRAACLMASLALGVCFTSAHATEIDNVVFFGDSLSDTGNIWFATSGFPPPPYFQGTAGAAPEFTGGQWSSPEGPSWPSLFAAQFGIAATPSAVPVPTANNYAWGGARTGVNPDPAGAPWLDQQVGLYVAGLQSGAQTPTPGTLVSIMIGGNDVANNLGNPAAAVAAGVASIITQVNNLYNAGVRQFLIANVPDIGATPRFQNEDLQTPGVAALATASTIAWNRALQAAVSQLTLDGAVINYFDFYSFSQDPELLGMFANTTDACLTETSICQNPASYFYWDTFHPSSTSHALLAEGLLASLASARFEQLLQDATGVGPGRALASKVRAAQKSFARSKYKAACGSLRALGNQLSALSGKKLPEETAAALGATASGLRQSLSCS